MLRDLDLFHLLSERGTVSIVAVRLHVPRKRNSQKGVHIGDLPRLQHVSHI